MRKSLFRTVDFQLPYFDRINEDQQYELIWICTFIFYAAGSHYRLVGETAFFFVRHRQKQSTTAV